jgi:membrane protease YdiL (CAAX protease family)
VIWRLSIFIGICLGFWMLAALPVYSFVGSPAAYASAVAMLICLVPAAITLAWTQWAQNRPPEQQLVAVLGGTALRLVTVALLGLILFKTVDFLQPDEAHFWSWVIGCYLFTLVVEMGMILSNRSQPVPAAPAQEPVTTK